VYLRLRSPPRILWKREETHVSFLPIGLWFEKQPGIFGAAVSTRSNVTTGLSSPLMFFGGVYDAKLLHLLVQGERRMSSERLEDLRVAINSRGHLFVYTRTGSPQLTLGTERHC